MLFLFVSDIVNISHGTNFDGPHIQYIVGVLKTSYQLLTIFLQISYKIFTKILWASYKYLQKSRELLQNFLWTYSKLFNILKNF
jgi:hypothetical protein